MNMSCAGIATHRTPERFKAHRDFAPYEKSHRGDRASQREWSEAERRVQRLVSQMLPQVAQAAMASLQGGRSVPFQQATPYTQPFAYPAQNLYPDPWTGSANAGYLPPVQGGGYLPTPVQPYSAYAGLGMLSPSLSAPQAVSASRTGDGGAGLDTESEALAVLADNMSSIAVDGLVTRDMLKAIAEGRLTGSAKNTDYAPELRAAAQYMLDHPAAFERLDTGDGRAFNHGGKQADGKYNLADLSVAMNENKMTRNEIRAFNKLKDVLDLLPAEFKMSDLERLAQDSSQPQAVRDAAAYAVQNKAMFQRLDVAKHGGAGDGIVGRGDIEAMSTRSEVVAAERRETRRAAASYRESYGATAV